MPICCSLTRTTAWSLPVSVGYRPRLEKASPWPSYRTCAAARRRLTDGQWHDQQQRMYDFYCRHSWIRTMSGDTPRVCIFCRAAGKLTDEHIWGQWIKQYVPATTNKHHFVDVRVPVPGQHLASTPRIRAGDPLNAKVAVVCANCNSGWMSRMQEAAKPHLIPLFDGRWPELSTPNQITIAKWVAMATMTAEHISRNRSQITESQARRESLMNGHIPEGWRIWIGRLRHPGLATQWIRATFPVVEGPKAPVILNHDAKPNMQTTAFAIGRLFVFAFSSAFPEIPAGWDWRSVPLARIRLRQLWPTDKLLHGPPPKDISHMLAGQIARAFLSYSDDLARRGGYMKHE